ncbi:hypothetical protein QBZ16_000955 [Prototheca wickerhamii]|uniref:Uncharacterized protein n=1 Tax=Prototheca wickerhamii TaxID=3111 RepID=A0AAD9IGY6_PROWI|nr:hypothetical protein QBZ16_000955 [Prototheca wickerhamii]
MVEVSRYGRARTRPLSWWANERLIYGSKERGVQGLSTGSQCGDLVGSFGPRSSKAPARKARGVAEPKSPGVKKGRGRSGGQTPGETGVDASGARSEPKEAAPPPRKRGRPKGSKNKPKPPKEEAAVLANEAPANLATLAALAGARAAAGSGAASSSQGTPRAGHGGLRAGLCLPRPAGAASALKGRGGLERADTQASSEAPVAAARGRKRATAQAQAQAYATPPARATPSDADDWTAAQVSALKSAWLDLDPKAPNFWAAVAARSFVQRVAKIARREARWDSAAAAAERAGDDGALLAVEEKRATQAVTDRYIDQILRKRGGRAWGALLEGRGGGGSGLIAAAVAPSADASRARLAAEDARREAQAALAAQAATAESEDARSDEESDYYWSDA